MKGKHTKMMTALAFIAGATACVSACGNKTNNTSTNNSPEQPSEVRAQVLENLATGVFQPAHEDFATKSEALEDAAAAWQAAPSDASKREAAQQAWTDAMLAWQTIEVYQVGPAGIMGSVAGGEDLRDQIYSWPLVNTCRVDQELVSMDYADEAEFESELINVRGLDAMEYLLFSDGDQNTCAPNSSINSSGDWAALDADTLNERRAQYTLTLARSVKAHADTLVSHWSADGSNFIAELTGAGDASETYESQQEALNAITDAMFYVEKETKDMKLAVPVGKTDCDTDTCPEEAESQFARISAAQVLANLRAFQVAYLGNAPGEEDRPGFDDLLVDVGAADVDMQMQSLIADAITRAEALDASLVKSLEVDPQKVNDLYDACKALGDLLKTQFISVLDLELPQRAEGDND